MKIPESNSDDLEKIMVRLKETLLLTVKITNLGSHATSSSITFEENLVKFSLGLVASIFPYIISLLRWFLH